MFIILLATEDFFAFVPGCLLKDSNTAQCPLHTNALATSCKHICTGSDSQSSPSGTHMGILKGALLLIWVIIKKWGLYSNVYDCAYCPT